MLSHLGFCGSACSTCTGPAQHQPALELQLFSSTSSFEHILRRYLSPFGQPAHQEHMHGSCTASANYVGLCRYIQPPPARGMFVSRPNEPPRQVKLVSGRPHVTKGNTVWLLTFKEIPDRDAAETLRNYKYVPPTSWCYRCHSRCLISLLDNAPQLLRRLWQSLAQCVRNFHVHAHAPSGYRFVNTTAW